MKHTNQQNKDEIPSPLRVRSNVDDRSAALLKSKGPRFEGFWVSGASSSDGGAHSAKGYCSRQRAGVERSGRTSQVGNVAEREQEKAQLLESAQPSDSSHTAHLISFPLRQFTSE